LTKKIKNLITLIVVVPKRRRYEVSRVGLDIRAFSIIWWAGWGFDSLYLLILLSFQRTETASKEIPERREICGGLDLLRCHFTNPLDWF